MEPKSGSGILGFLALKAVCCVGLALVVSGTLTGFSLWLGDVSPLVIGLFGLTLMAAIVFGYFRRRRCKAEISRTQLPVSQ